MARDDLLERLITWVADELLGGDAAELDAHTPLLEWGVIDSMSMMRLLSFIDAELGIRVPDGAVRPEHFASLDALVRMLNRLDDEHRSVA